MLFCCICDEPITDRGCKHTAEERKAYECDLAWEGHCDDFEDLSTEQRIFESQRADEVNNTWREGIYHDEEGNPDPGQVR